jgi:hypothetical protein
MGDDERQRCVRQPWARGMLVGKGRCGPENRRSGGLREGVVSGIVMASGYRAFAALALITLAAKVAKICTCSTSAKSYSCETLLGWPPENFKDLSFAISGSTSELASLTRDGHRC